MNNIKIESQEKREMVTIFVPKVVRKKLKERAARTGRTMYDEIDHMIDELPEKNKD